MSDNKEIDRLAEDAKTAAEDYGCAVFGDSGIDRCCETWDSVVAAIDRLANLARTPSGTGETMDAVRYRWLRVDLAASAVPRVWASDEGANPTRCLHLAELDAAMACSAPSTPIQEGE